MKKLVKVYAQLHSEGRRRSSQALKFHLLSWLTTISPLKLPVNSTSVKAFPDCCSAIIKSWFYDPRIIWTLPFRERKDNICIVNSGNVFCSSLVCKLHKLPWWYRPIRSDKALWSWKSRAEPEVASLSYLFFFIGPLVSFKYQTCIYDIGYMAMSKCLAVILKYFIFWHTYSRILDHSRPNFRYWYSDIELWHLVIKWHLANLAQATLVKISGISSLQISSNAMCFMQSRSKHQTAAQVFIPVSYVQLLTGVYYLFYKLSIHSRKTPNRLANANCSYGKATAFNQVSEL